MQNDLISRSALDVDLQNLVREYNRNCESDKSAGAFEALYHLRLAPAVDAVEVMRCKDCEMIKQGRFDIFGLAYCDLWKTDMQMDNYCCFGNRRADDGK